MRPVDLDDIPPAKPSDKPREPRLSKAEFRQLLLTTGAEMVLEMGGLPPTLPGEVDLERVVERAGVARGTAYRYWDKESFAEDLLCYLASPAWQGAPAFDAKTLELASEVVVNNLERLTDEEGRWAVLDEAIRKGAKQNFDAVTQGVQWRSFIVLTANLLAMEEGEHKERLRERLIEAEMRFIEQMSSFYEAMATVLGFKLKYTEGFDTLAAAGAAIIEGLALKTILIPSIVDRAVQIDTLDPEDRMWGVPALAFRGVVKALIEIDDDYEPTKALAEYFRTTSSATPPA